MEDLTYQELVRLGTENPALRPHIRPVLAAMETRTGGSNGTWTMNRSTIFTENTVSPVGLYAGELTQPAARFAREIEKLLSKVQKEVTSFEYKLEKKAFLGVDGKSILIKHEITYWQDAEDAERAMESLMKWSRPFGVTINVRQ